jgi:hypothetical protein
MGLGVAGAALAGCTASDFGQLGASLVDENQVQQMGLSAFQEIKQETPISGGPRARAFVERTSLKSRPASAA